MDLITGKGALLERLDDWRRAGDHVVLVPTMGNLHEGHLSLVKAARQHGERVVVSVFVNPTQFGEGEDFTSYPRTLKRDTHRVRQVNADLLFVPDVEVMYPFGINESTRVVVPYLTDILCGASRPGHFDGVTSVVTRLFSIVRPDVAVFGQKDYQQQLIIRRLVEDLCMPIQIVTAPTQRETDGLAMSSRNQYLSDDEREIAPELYAALHDVAEALENGQRNFAEQERLATLRLKAVGFEPDYVAIRRAVNLQTPDRDDDHLIVLGAALLGKARLIDNVLVHV